MLEAQDMEVIVDAVHQVVERVVGERMEQVYHVIEEMRQGMVGTVEVLNGNDTALLGELRKIQHATPAEVLTMAGESWAAFIQHEAERIGMTVVGDLGKYSIVEDTETVSTPTVTIKPKAKS